MLHSGTALGPFSLEERLRDGIMEAIQQCSRVALLGIIIASSYQYKIVIKSSTKRLKDVKSGPLITKDKPGNYRPLSLASVVASSSYV